MNPQNRSNSFHHPAHDDIKRRTQRDFVVSIALALSVFSLILEEARGAETVSPTLKRSSQNNARSISRPDNEKAQTLVHRAVGEYRKGNLKRARSLVLQARKIDPYRVATYQMEAQIAHDLGDRRGYLVALKAILSANPSSPKLQNAVGKLLVQAGQSDEGLAAQQKAVRIAPNRPQYAKDFAAALVAHGRHSDAANVLTRTIKQHPQDKDLPIALARLHEAAGAWQSAVFYYEVASRHAPKNLLWQKRWAHCLYQMKKFNEAYVVYSKCMDPNLSSYPLADYVLFGDTCLQIGKLEVAQKVFDRISQDHPGRSKDVELLRGFCAYKRGDISGAKRIIGNALSQWPRDDDLSALIRLCTAEKAEKNVSNDVISAVGQ